MIDVLAEKIINLEALFQKAAWVESCLPENTVRRMDAKSGFPEYLYDADDRADQEPTFMRIKPSAIEIQQWEIVKGWLNLLGMRQDTRTVIGKKIVWMKAEGYSFADISEFLRKKTNHQISTTSTFYWYKQDIVILAKKIKGI